MFESVHRFGSSIRQSSLLRRQQWLWHVVEPAWQSAFRVVCSQGFKTRVNDDVFRLEYEQGARYDHSERRTYEPIVYRALDEAIREGMTVFDIGAHIGLVTLAAAKRVGPSGRVFAFEPAPNALRVLRHHVALNGYGDRVETVSAVISDTNGTAPFYVCGDSMSASLGRDNLDVLSPQRLGDPDFRAVEIVVPAVTVDQFVKDRVVDPDVVKIDVEGAELLVLRGARELLLRKPVVMVCEIHPLQMHACGSSVAELDRYLEEIEYVTEKLDAPGPQGIFHVRITQRTASE